MNHLVNPAELLPPKFQKLMQAFQMMDLIKNRKKARKAKRNVRDRKKAINRMLRNQKDLIDEVHVMTKNNSKLQRFMNR